MVQALGLLKGSEDKGGIFDDEDEEGVDDFFGSKPSEPAPADKSDNDDEAEEAESAKAPKTKAASLTTPSVGVPAECFETRD